MDNSNSNTNIPDEVIMNKIYLIRGKKVMLDRDLAEIYNIETKVLKQSVRRYMKRFPQDFMFEMTAKELDNWRSQIVTSNSEKMGLRYPPFCFTEHGVIMLAIFEYLAELKKNKRKESLQKKRNPIGYKR